MKIQYKAALWITILGVIIVTLLSIGYDTISHNIVEEKELKNILNVSDQVSLHLESHLLEKASIAMTLSSAPTIKKALLKSNKEFASLKDDDRKLKISRLNKQWMETSDRNDSFIKSRMTNPVANFLKSQQKIIPGEYGELFLTNRYGVMISTTGKLTTLAHAHKYWWKACYNDGAGNIFLDDRGFDTSVKGYVLGVVVPIRDGDEIIGILKCNVNIMGSLTDVVQEFSRKPNLRILIARSGGLIVSEKNVIPLSTSINNKLVELLKQRNSGSKNILNNEEEEILVSYSPVKVTLGSKEIGFGGKKESIDHIKGNKGEGWFVICSIPEEIALDSAHDTTKLIILTGLIFTILTTLAALFLGKQAAKPIVKLAEISKSIGDGNLSTRTDISSNDEIGSLAESINTMAQNLQETMTSRDELIIEVEQRKKAEEEKEKIIDDLEKALEDIKTLSGIVPICSYCKQIRDDKGYWNKLEKYISERSDAKFSHGICDECIKKYYSDLDV